MLIYVKWKFAWVFLAFLTVPYTDTCNWILPPNLKVTIQWSKCFLLNIELIFITNQFQKSYWFSVKLACYYKLWELGIHVIRRPTFKSIKCPQWLLKSRLQESGGRSRQYCLYTFWFYIDCYPTCKMQ